MKRHKTTCHFKGREGGKVIKCNRKTLTLVWSALQQMAWPSYRQKAQTTISLWIVQTLANPNSSGIGTRQSSIIGQQGVLSEALFPEWREWKRWPCNSRVLVTPHGTVFRHVPLTAFYKCLCKCFNNFGHVQMIWCYQIFPNPNRCCTMYRGVTYAVYLHMFNPNSLVIRKECSTWNSIKSNIFLWNKWNEFVREQVEILTITIIMIDKNNDKKNIITITTRGLKMMLMAMMMKVREDGNDDDNGYDDDVKMTE